ncbi:hypothetical protein ABXN37_19495 [Piscinibacter sakaiensis]|uniref:Uncharacterized protein n=1 Tax=Piscinibacter sakaiensis TaxID=1547922 RepID=A0A0K8P3X3_PISS1|nr:hypothetical protein ISF6_3167 [Piscinibacter sakaiensis]
MRQHADLEEILADHLVASGLSPEAARTSAVSFVTLTAMHFAAG